jgi:tetratricopeptide (TPR) repeat protein
MMRSASVAIVAASMVLLLGGAIALQIVRDRWYERPGVQLTPVLYVRSPEAMRRLTLGFSALAADIEWIRAIQHYGRGRTASATSPQTFPLLFPLLDRATTLDPMFNIAFRFGAVFLAERPPGGPGRSDLAIALLKKGIAARPDTWQYYQDVGFVYYWQLHDYRSASEWFDRGGRLAGAPWWLRTMAAAILTRGGDRGAARLLWQQILSTADNDYLRDKATTSLAQLDALDLIDQLHAIVGRFHSETDRLPRSWDALIGAGLLSGVPLDPAGVPFVLDAETGRVTVSKSSVLHPLPTDMPGGAGAPR